MCTTTVEAEGVNKSVLQCRVNVKLHTRCASQSLTLGGAAVQVLSQEHQSRMCAEE